MKFIVSTTHCKSIALALAALCAGPIAAHAVSLSVEFSFEDSNGLVTGDASLTGEALANDPGAFLATAGDLNITAPSADNIAGDYKLVLNPLASNNSSTSPTGLFIYDNVIMPGGNPVVTWPGLLGFGGFASGAAPEGQGREINFFSTGPNTYDLYTGVSGGYPYSHEFTTAQGTVVAKVTSVRGEGLLAAPEPSTWLIMGSFLLIGLRKARPGKGAAGQRPASSC